MRAATFLLMLGATLSGCTLLFDPDRVTYEDEQRDAGKDDAGMADAGMRDATVPDSGPRDAGEADAHRVDGGPPPCGQIGEACCAAPRPACAAGANCTLDGCQACGGPGEECCTSGAACQVAGCVPATQRCPTVTPLVDVAVPGGGTYGIDAHEVTRTQYEEWLATSPTPSGALVGEGCGGNTDLAPSASCLAAGFDCTGASCGGRPQTCVDWCDAFAYCAAIGKQLCGRYGPGEISISSFTDASLSPWYNACSSGGMYLFPTGDSGGDADDNCQFTDLGGSADAASLTGCQSSVPGYEGVLALTGNVREWANGCDGNDASARCLAMGGAYLDNDWYEGQCNFPNTLPRTSTTASTGFRCCELAP